MNGDSYGGGDYEESLNEPPDTQTWGVMGLDLDYNKLERGGRRQRGLRTVEGRLQSKPTASGEPQRREGGRGDPSEFARRTKSIHTRKKAGNAKHTASL